MIKQSLHDGWIARAISNFSAVPGAIRDATIPARVPGCIHTDLMRAGLIEDPYFGQNEPKLTWIGRTDWQYTTYFEADPKLFDHERIDLVCDGLDTVATVVLNGAEVAKTQNMHRGYRFDVRPMLKKGKNELVIRFESPVNYAANMRDKLGYLPGIFYGGAYNFIRKMACNFGWDWGPVVPTCGIWRGVRLEGWSRSRIISVKTWVDSLTKLEAILNVAVDVERSSNSARDLVVNLYLPDACGVDIENRGDGVQTFAIPTPAYWWPAGHGSRTLYELDIVSLEMNDLKPKEKMVIADRIRKRIGLRTVELDSSPDDIGRKFVVKVNGNPIFCKGYNWIPDDCFLDRACTPERYRKRIQQTLDSNANMLRVWGGGIYESDDFYDICDEMGILVWQDFLFACAAYPEAEPFKSEVEAEARYNVARLAHHPSLVLWNGCNENLWMYRDNTGDDGTGKQVKWTEQLKGKTWGAGYYLDLLPKVVKEVDPSRPYWAASPWSGDPDVDHGVHPNAETHGNKHIWEVWHGPGDYTNYRKFAPRFCSEFGYQGPANYSTMAKFFQGQGARGEGQEKKEDSPSCPLPLATRPLWSEWLELHQKSPGGNARNERLLAKDFDIPENLDDWHYLLQLNQARALTAGVEWFRSRQPVCMGTLYWQLNDCYPVTSWAAIDSEGQFKPLWYATRRFYAPRLLTIQPEGDWLVVYCNNDNDEIWRGSMLIRRWDFWGKELAKTTIDIEVQPRSNLRAGVVPKQVAQPSDPTREFIVAQLGDMRSTWFFKSDRDLVYPTPSPRASLNGNQLLIQTDVLLRDATINIDRIDPAATISENCITLLPGESMTFVINSSKKLERDQLMNAPVFQCANRFGSR